MWCVLLRDHVPVPFWLLTLFVPGLILPFTFVGLRGADGRVKERHGHQVRLQLPIGTLSISVYLDGVNTSDVKLNRDKLNYFRAL